MKEVVVYIHDQEESNPWLDAFCVGLKRHGVDVERAAYKRPKPGHVGVLYGIRNMPRISPYSERCLVMEMGFVGDRYKYQSLLFDGLNGRGSHPKASDGGARWQRLFGDIPVKPWRDGGDYVLLVGQWANDQSVLHMDVNTWYVQAAGEIRSVSSLPVCFRPHPLSDQHRHRAPKMPGVEIVHGPIDEALAGAAMVVTLNSNVGVLAALAGVPVVAMDEGSMAWPVASHRIGEQVRPDRSDWIADLAWAQWLQEEMAAGDAWDHLRKAL